MAKKKKITTKQGDSPSKKHADDGSLIKEAGASSNRAIVPTTNSSPVVGYNEFGEELVQAPSKLLAPDAGPVTRTELGFLEELQQELEMGRKQQSNGDGEQVPEVIQPDPSSGNPGRMEAALKVSGENTGKSWAGVLRGDYKRGNSLSYILPGKSDEKLVAELQIDDVKAEIKKWEHALIVYVVGNNPAFAAFNAYIMRNWNNIVLPEVFKHDDGYYIVRFATEGDKKKVVNAGPYFYNSRPVIMRDWTDDYKFANDVVRTMPLWVRLPGLPLHCWGVGSLSRIGSLLGSPICSDECTANQSRVSYARILVEIDVTKALTRSVFIQLNGKVFEQKVLYEWAPPFCTQCNKAGHNCAAKKAPAIKRVWRPKQVQNQPQTKADEGVKSELQEGQAQQQKDEQQEQPEQQQGDQVAETPKALAVVPGTPTVNEGWQVVQKTSGKKPAILTRFRGVDKKTVSPLSFSNAYLALIEEGDEEGEVMKEKGEGKEVAQPP